MQLSELLAALDPNTYAQMKQESGFNPMAVSSKGAAGLMQIMPATARDPGFGVTPLQGWDGKDPRTAPLEEQVRFGKDYQAAMEARYGNRAGGLAAYNAGPGRMDAVLAGKATMPAETKDYVNKITGGQAVPNMPAQAPASPQYPPMPQPVNNAPALQQMPSPPQMNAQSRDGYEDRTAGLKKFNAGEQPKVSKMSALEKFGNLVKEARQPGSFEAQAPQPIQPPQQPSGLAQFASAFIPGLGQAMESGQQRKIAEYAATLQPEAALKYLATVDPEKFLHRLMDYQTRGGADSLERERFEETKRHNQFTEKLAQQRITQGQDYVDPDTGEIVKGQGKILPGSMTKPLLDNRTNLRKARNAYKLITGVDLTDKDGNVIAKADKDATGYKGYLPDAVLQRTDEGGIDTRAAIADLGSMVIHDRSGAAVTAAETPRLKPFIPMVTDDPVTVKKKLARFVQEYKAITGEMEEFYRESGYRVPEANEEGEPASPTPQYKEGQTATNKTTGEKVIFRGGKWEKM